LVNPLKPRQQRDKTKSAVCVAKTLSPWSYNILPKGFRRTRDYGFLHGNAKRKLNIVQWGLKVLLSPPKK